MSAPAVAREVKANTVLSALKNVSYDGSDPKQFIFFKIKVEAVFEALGYTAALQGEGDLIEVQQRLGYASLTAALQGTALLHAATAPTHYLHEAWSILVDTFGHDETTSTYKAATLEELLSVEQVPLDQGSREPKFDGTQISGVQQTQ